MTHNEQRTLGELWRKLYGDAEHPDDPGDVPEMKDRLASIEIVVHEIAALYRATIRIGKIATAVTAIVGLVVAITNVIA